MNKDAEGRWKVGRSYIKLNMRAGSMMSLQPGRAASSLQKTLRSEAAHGIFSEGLDPQPAPLESRPAGPSFAYLRAFRARRAQRRGWRSGR